MYPQHELPEGIESVELEGDEAIKAWDTAENSYADTEPAPLEPATVPKDEVEDLISNEDFWRDSEFSKIE